MLKFVYLVLVICILLVLDFWAIFGIANDEITWFRYLNYFGVYLPVFSLFLIAGVFYSYRTRGKWLKIFVCTIGLPVLCWPYIFMNAVYGGSLQTEPTEEHADSIFSFVSFSKMSRNKDFDKISKLIDCSKYDVITTQESSFMKSAAEEGRFKKCGYAFNKSGSIGVYSSFPVESIKSNNYAGLFRVEFPHGKNVFVIGFRFEKVYSSKSKGNSVKLKQLETVESWLSDIKGPLVLAGDFNDTIFNHSVISVSRSMSYAKAGLLLGFNNTFPAEGRLIGSIIPLIRIDHVFFRNLSLVGANVFDESFGSDHYPIFNQFRFQGSVGKN